MLPALKNAASAKKSQKIFAQIEKDAKSTVSKLQKWHAPKNKSQLTRQIDTASTNMTQAALLALLVFCMSVLLWDKTNVKGEFSLMTPSLLLCISPNFTYNFNDKHFH